MEQTVVKTESEELVDDSKGVILMNYNGPSTSVNQEMPSTSGIAIKQEIKEELNDSDNSINYDESGVKEESESSTDEEHDFDEAEQVKLKLEAKDEILLDQGLPSDIEEQALKAISDLLPEKSKSKYEIAYAKYEKWCTEKEIRSFANEKVLLSYFSSLSKVCKPSSLWAYYSMIRTMISIKHNADISKHTNLIAFLKRNHKGYRAKKSRVLTRMDVTKFLEEADNKQFLFMKVALIVGLAGACRREELTYLLLDNVKDEGTCFHFFLPNTKTKVPRDFFVTCGNIDGINMVEIIRSYIALRPNSIDHRRFFVQYKRGKCIRHPVGINTFGNLTKKIALYLKLDHSEEYTGHCLRRSSKSLLADSGADLLTVKSHRNSDVNTNDHAINVSSHSSLLASTSGIHLEHCKDCVINIYNK
ncbi:unnamed protein product [Brassicogethes aeneus]|uniref:Tyr recombinase domain-containing protein n=1 Tax=Brassicogethes aeneus TaxID=1431903 RepID=A0A9P0AW54_BRAAE|nr:unnamed protein product [Brassicogethes aeneus]